jgi:hypothetical protein
MEELINSIGKILGFLSCMTPSLSFLFFLKMVGLSQYFEQSVERAETSLRDGCYFLLDDFYVFNHIVCVSIGATKESCKWQYALCGLCHALILARQNKHKLFDSVSGVQPKSEEVIQYIHIYIYIYRRLLPFFHLTLKSLMFFSFQFLAQSVCSAFSRTLYILCSGREFQWGY